jgi:hypothetical protein
MQIFHPMARNLDQELLERLQLVWALLILTQNYKI